MSRRIDRDADKLIAMKLQRLILGLLFLAGLFTVSALAQTNGATTNTVPDVTGSPLPSSTSDFWTYAIAVIVPLLVGLMKKLVPKLPAWLLPVSTPFVGILLGAGLKALGAAEMTWVDMAQAGGLAVLVRESWNQIVTKNAVGEEAAKTKGPNEA